MQVGDIIALIEAIVLTARSPKGIIPKLAMRRNGVIGIIPKLAIRRNGVTIPTSIDRAIGITTSHTTTTNGLDLITDTALTTTTILVATTGDILST